MAVAMAVIMTLVGAAAFFTTLFATVIPTVMAVVHAVLVVPRGGGVGVRMGSVAVHEVHRLVTGTVLSTIA